MKHFGEQDTREYLTTAQVAERLGLSRAAVSELCRLGKLPGAFKKGSAWRIPESAVDAWFSTTDNPSPNPTPSQVWARFREQPLVFWPTLLLGGFVAIAGLLFALISAGADFGGAKQQFIEWGLVRPFRKQEEGETLVVIATFYSGPGAKDSDIQDELAAAINDQANKLGLLALQAIVDPTVLRADQLDEARALGLRYNATMVIWGSDTDFRIEVNFLNPNTPADFLFSSGTIEEQVRTSVAYPTDYVEFVVNELSPSIAFLSLFAIGQSALNNGDYQIAATVLEYALTEQSENLSKSVKSDLNKVWFILAFTNMVQGELEIALDRYSMSIKLNPSPEALLNRGNVYNALGNQEAALADYGRLIGLEANYVGYLAAGYVNRADIYLDRENHSAALADLTEAIRINPEFDMAYSNRGYAYTLVGKLDEALADLNEAIRLNPSNANAYSIRGWVHTHRANYQAALSDFNEALQLDPSDFLTYYFRGQTFVSLEDKPSALSDFSEAIKLNPDDSASYFARGKVYTDLEDYDKALLDLNEAIRLDSTNESYIYYRGLIFSTLGEHDAALADFDQVVHLNPELSSAYGNRGLAYRALKDYDASLSDLNEAIRLDPEYALAYLNRGHVHADKGEVEAAIADYTHAIELDPGMIDAYINRGYFYRELGLNEEAISDFTQAIRLDPDSEVAEELNRWVTELKNQSTDD